MAIVFQKNTLSASDYLALRPEIPEAVACRAIEGSTVTVRVIDDGRTVGMLRALSDGAMFCYFQDIYLAPAYRGRGIGKQMVEYAMDAVCAQITTGGYLILTVMAEPGRESFYETLGFQKAPNALAGHAMQCVLQK